MHKKSAKTPKVRRSVFCEQGVLMKIILGRILNDVETTPGKYFALGIQFLILLSLVTFSIETLPDLSPSVRSLLRNTEVVLVMIFSIEYIARLYVAEKKLSFVFSFFGLIDLIAILPFYLALGLDLRSVRVFRLLRLFRIFKLLRYSDAINRFHRALVIAREELILFSCVTLIMVYMAAVGIYYFENVAQPETFKSIFHSLWWAVATLTTVGYGEIYPITIGGKVFTFIVLMIGLGIVAVPTGLVSSALSQVRAEDRSS